MPHPRITEPEIPRFENALVSFNGCTLEGVHKRLILRINECIERERIPIDEACDAIAHLVNSNRDQVKEKLGACQPKTPVERPSRPRPEAWPSIRNAQKDIR